MLSRFRGLASLHGEPTDAFPYRAVSVVPTPCSCPAAVAIRHTRFLLAEAPTLPLPMCTWPLSCPCQLVTHHDRRASGRREAESDEIPSDRRNRRSGRGRRITD